MSTFKVKLAIVTNKDSQPKWVYDSITEQLEENEQGLGVEYNLIDNTTFEVNFIIKTNYEHQPKWVYDTVSDQLEDDEFIISIEYELIE